MNKLPEELKDHIVHECHLLDGGHFRLFSRYPVRAVFALSCCSRDWRRICIPILFHSINVGSLPNRLLLRFILDNAYSLRYCSKLSIAWYPPQGKVDPLLRNEHTDPPNAPPEESRVSNEANLLNKRKELASRACSWRDPEYDQFWEEMSNQFHGSWAEKRFTILLETRSILYNVKHLSFHFLGLTTTPCMTSPFLNHGITYFASIAITSFSCFGHIPSEMELIFMALNVKAIHIQTNFTPVSLLSSMFENTSCESLEIISPRSNFYVITAADIDSSFSAPLQNLSLAMAMDVTVITNLLLRNSTTIEVLSLRDLVTADRDNSLQMVPAFSPELFPRLYKLVLPIELQEQYLRIFSDLSIRHLVVDASSLSPLFLASTLIRRYFQLEILEVYRSHDGPIPDWEDEGELRPLFDLCIERNISLTLYKS